MTRLFCLDCGNDESFYREDKVYRDVTEYGIEKRLLDSEGDVEDYGDFDFINSDYNDSGTEEEGEITCNECDSEDVIDLEELDYDEYEEHKEVLNEAGYYWDEEQKEVVDKSEIQKNKLELLKQKLMEE